MEEEKQVRISATKTFLCIVESNSTFLNSFNTTGETCKITLKRQQADIKCVKKQALLLDLANTFRKSAHPCTTTSKIKHSTRKNASYRWQISHIWDQWSSSPVILTWQCYTGLTLRCNATQTSDKRFCVKKKSCYFLFLFTFYS
jgi:hypothetical protein